MWRRMPFQELKKMWNVSWLEGLNRKQEIGNDDFLMQIKKDIQEGITLHKGFTLHHELLFYKDCPIIPWNSSLIKRFSKNAMVDQ